MHDQKLSKKYYENKEVWAQKPLVYQINVLSDIRYILPKDIVSVLDVGCGDGFIINQLPQNLDIVGVDWSDAALDQVLRKKLKSDITNIPLESKSFDLVMINDVIEHIDDNSIPYVLSEVSRLAKDYILVTVPFEERLKNNNTFCLNCGVKYHINLHLRSYNIFQLLYLFDNLSEWKPVDVILSGEEYNNHYILNESVRSYLGQVRSNEHCHCQVCGFNGNYRMSNVDSQYSFKQKNELIPNIVSKVCPRNECIVLFKRVLEPKSRSLFSVLTENGDEINGKFNTTLGELLLNGDDIDLVKKTESSVVVKFDEINYHLRRFEIINDNSIKIPDWFMNQIYFCSRQNIYSFELLDKYQNLLVQNILDSQQTIDLQNARAELGILKRQLGQTEQQAIDLQNARAELGILKRQLGQTEQQAIDLQNARAELGILKSQLGQTEQQAIDLQNARAELGILKSQLGQTEQQAIDLQNARAELDVLKLRLGQTEQQAIDLQNARAELDVLKLRLGQTEQQAIDLQNARAELDVLKLRLGQTEQQAIDLQNARAELDVLKLQLGQTEQQVIDCKMQE